MRSTGEVGVHLKAQVNYLLYVRRLLYMCYLCKKEIVANGEKKNNNRTTERRSREKFKEKRRKKNKKQEKRNIEMK